MGAFRRSATPPRRNSKHVRSTRTSIERIITQTRAEKLSDLTPSAVAIALSRVADREGLSARAINAHATAIKAFARWAWRDGRVRAYDLANIDRRNEQADRRYVRRPLTGDELRTLIRTTRAAGPWRGVAGVVRGWFSAPGGVTGSRRSELGALRPDDFELDGPAPSVRLGGEHTKNGREAEQPIPPALAKDLRPWLATKAPGTLVFALPE